MELSGETLAAIAGGVVGSIVSGIIALALQVTAQRASVKREKEREADADRASLQTIFMVVQQCSAAAHNYLTVIRAAEAEAAGRPIWQALKAFAGPHPKVEIAPLDMGVLLKLGQGELFNNVRDTVASHNGQHDAWSAYSELRREFGRRVPADMTGNRGVATLAGEELRQIGPLVAEMESVSRELHARIQPEEQLARQTLVGVVQALEKFAGVKLEIRWAGQRAAVGNLEQPAKKAG